MSVEYFIVDTVDAGDHFTAHSPWPTTPPHSFPRARDIVSRVNHRKNAAGQLAESQLQDFQLGLLCRLFQVATPWARA